MHERAWVVLLVRGLGLLLIGMWGPSMVSAIITISYSLQSGSMVGAGSRVLLEQHLLSSVQDLIATGFGVYLLLGGRWVIERLCKQMVGVCPACGERANPVACAECGYGLAGNRNRQAASGRDGEEADAD